MALEWTEREDINSPDSKAYASKGDHGIAYAITRRGAGFVVGQTAGFVVEWADVGGRELVDFPDHAGRLGVVVFDRAPPPYATLAAAQDQCERAESVIAGVRSAGTDTQQPTRDIS